LIPLRGIFTGSNVRTVRPDAEPAEASKGSGCRFISFDKLRMNGRRVHFFHDKPQHIAISKQVPWKSIFGVALHPSSFRRTDKYASFLGFRAP
jgi:hypothetical protein